MFCVVFMCVAVYTWCLGVCGVLVVYTVIVCVVRILCIVCPTSPRNNASPVGGSSPQAARVCYFRWQVGVYGVGMRCMMYVGMAVSGEVCRLYGVLCLCIVLWMFVSVMNVMFVCVCM